MRNQISKIEPESSKTKEKRQNMLHRRTEECCKSHRFNSFKNTWEIIFIQNGKITYEAYSKSENKNT